jgi:hypothetical protein
MSITAFTLSPSGLEAWGIGWLILKCLFQLGQHDRQIFCAARANPLDNQKHRALVVALKVEADGVRIL